jgi:L-amino acid N-acyltransferase YncA
MIEIRPAAAGDAAAITAIHNQGITGRGATFDTTPRTNEDSAARIRDADRLPLLVAVEDDGVVGWAGLYAYRPRDCYAGIAEVSVYVDASARGRGIGRQLLLAVIEAAAARGFWKLVSRVFPFNHASRAACRAAGFREVGTYEKHARLDGRWLDVVIVERLIPENLTDDAGPAAVHSATPAADAAIA